MPKVENHIKKKKRRNTEAIFELQQYQDIIYDACETLNISTVENKANCNYVYDINSYIP